MHHFTIESDMMNTLKALFLALSLPLISSTYAQTWEVVHDFDMSTAESIYGVAWTQENGLMISGTQWKPFDDAGTYPTRTFVARLDTLGQIIWKNTFIIGSGEGGSFQAMEIFPLNGGENFIIFGNSSETLNDSSYADIVIMNVSKDGEMIWQRIIGGQNADLVKSVVLMPNGNFAMGHLDNTQRHMYISEVDHSGMVLWTHTLADMDFYLARLELLPDGGFVVIGSDWDINDFVIKRLDSSGDEVWSRKYGTEQVDFAHEVAVSDNGNIYVLGYTRSDPTLRLLIIALNQEGELVGTKSFSSRNAGGGYFPPPMSLTKLCDSGFAVTSVHEENGSPDDGQGHVLRFDKNFELLWEALIGDEDKHERFFNIMEFSEEYCNFHTSDPDTIFSNPELVCVGRSYSDDGGGNAFVVKVNAGGVVSGINDGLSGFISDLSVFPNPGYGTVNGYSINSEIQSVVVYSMTGVPVFSVLFDDPDENFELDLTPLAQGAYLICTRNENGLVVGRNLWVKQ